VRVKFSPDGPFFLRHRASNRRVDDRRDRDRNRSRSTPPKPARRIWSRDLIAGATFTSKQQNFPNGCHICELEIDADTGEVEILRLQRRRRCPAR